MNNWLNENGTQIDYYITSKDVILIERKKHLELLLDLFHAYFPEPKSLRILDVGCGDGIVTKMLLNLHPENEYYLLDGSATMLEKAKANIEAQNVVFIQDTFENYFSTTDKENYFDIVFSSMAIHHVEHTKKKELYSKIFTILKDGGIFVNIDMVLPKSNKTEEIQFSMWTKYIDALLSFENRTFEIGTHAELPKIYKNKTENKPSSLVSQLTMLEDIGYRDVECYHKYGVFALFGGSK